jgi:hypothetical protein
MMLMLLAFLAGASTSEADQRLSRMITLYDQVCLTAFPDDKAVEALMMARAAKQLSPEEVKVTMRDDPARGWDLNDGGATLWIEYPPFHACSVRWNTPQAVDLASYRVIAAKYEGLLGGFVPADPYDADQGDIHIHATGEQRTLSDRSLESLFIFEQHISNTKRREAGETGMVLRFVHQFAPPASNGAQ